MTGRKNTALSRRTTPLSLTMILLFVCSFGLISAVYAFVNEAISIALEAATPYVEQGFEVREDNWSGEVVSGKPLLVRHQLFRGNEYWFWAGTSWPGSTVEVSIFDKKGMSVGLEDFSKKGMAGVRVLPRKTGTYFIRVVVTLKKEDAPPGEEIPESLDWGLTYGYR